MDLISTKEIVDVIRHSDNAAIIVQKKPIVATDKYKATYSLINFETRTVEVMTKSAYLLKKYGPSYAEIEKGLPNFVQCDAGVLYDRRVLVIYPNGEAGIFNRDGKFEWNGQFMFHECPIKNLALEGKYFWSICPKQNCVIRYACQNMKVDLRIGGIDATTFLSPVHITYDDGDIYVACDNNKIRKIDGVNFTVSDYKTFNEKVKRFYKFGKYEIVTLISGTYFIEND